MGRAVLRCGCEIGSASVLAGRIRSARTPPLPPPGWKPGSTAGRRPATTTSLRLPSWLP